MTTSDAPATRASERGHTVTPCPDCGAPVFTVPRATGGLLFDADVRVFHCADRGDEVLEAPPYEMPNCFALHFQTCPARKHGADLGEAYKARRAAAARGRA